MSDKFDQDMYAATLISSLESQLSTAQSETKRLRAALEMCIGWIEPVMDGFKIPQDAQSRIEVLEASKRLL